MVYREQEAYGQALDCYEHSLALHNQITDNEDNQSFLLNLIGIIHCLRNDYQDGLTHFVQAVKLKPEDTNYLDWHGIAYYASQDYEAAIIHFTQAIELLPEYNNFYRWRGLCYLHTGDYATALQDLNRTCELDDKDWDHFFLRSVAHYLLENTDAYRLDLEQATSLVEEEIDACMQPRGRARIALFTNRPDEAKQNYSQPLSNNDCTPHQLRMELSYIQLLARLFPMHKDIQSVSKWFAEKLKLKTVK